MTNPQMAYPSSMTTAFAKWDIVYPLRYPEAILCSSCHNYFTINPQQECLHCHTFNHVSNIIAKVRPMILWIDKSKWYSSMTFGIPLSTSRFFTDNHNEAISIAHCVFLDKKYEKPMRAVLSQATRADGNVLLAKHKVGQVTDLAIRANIENKLLNWLFD